jgi:uncharacterized protein (UPF0333 family)
MGTKKEIGQNVKKRMGTRSFVGGVILAGIVIITGAVYLGKSDSGEINVTATIQNSNKANSAIEGNSSKDVATVPEVFKNLPNGGLVPQQNQNQNTNTENTPTETASNTPQTGTSTEPAVTATGTTETVAE